MAAVPQERPTRRVKPFYAELKKRTTEDRYLRTDVQLPPNIVGIRYLQALGLFAVSGVDSLEQPLSLPTAGLRW